MSPNRRVAVVIHASAIVVASAIAVSGCGRGAKPELEHYRNSQYQRTGKLLTNYIDFSFDYPKNWKIRTVDPDNINFVTVERSVDNKTWENFNVSYYTPSTSSDSNEQLVSKLLAQVEQQYRQQARNFRRVSEGLDAVGHYPGHGAVFTGTLDVSGKPVEIYSRIVFVGLGTTTGPSGLAVTMMGTSFHPDLHRAEDLGRKGELPLIMDSFVISR